MFRKLLLAAFAAVTALAAQPASSAAQKALVYCPTGADAGGCARIVSAISGKFAAVDRAYDGTDGTLDLRTADLDHYAVIVVPSLADASTGSAQAAGDRRPYELLRGQAARMKLAVTGRVAVFSGAPDQGAANREAKDAIIANLVRWAAEGHTRPVGLVGLVAFQDLSDDAASRYDWVTKASPVDVSADVELRSFRSVKTQATVRSSFFSKGDAELAYPNMASYGLHIGKNAAARTISAAVGGDAGQTVLVTYGEPGAVGPVMLASVAGGDTAWIDTDKQDYLPGDIVTFTGGNWAPGDSVKVTIHEDPHWVPEHNDRYIIGVAGQDGKFTNRDFVIHTNDFGVTFTATAVGTSGKTAQHVFTDGSMTLTASVAGVSVTAIVTKYAAVSCGGSGTASTQTFSSTSAATVGGINKDESVKVELSSIAPVSATFNSWNTAGLSNVTIATLTPTSICVTATTNAGGGTLSANVTSSVATTTTVNAASATFADASVTLSATVAPTTGPAVGAGSVTFTVKQGATTIGVAATDNSVVAGAASVSYALPAGTAAGSYTVEATYTPGAGFGGSSGSGTLNIGKASTTTTVTCTAGPFTYTGAAQTPCSASVTGAGGLNQSLTVSYSNNTDAGTATASASYIESTNYLGSGDTENFTIGQAATTTTVTCTPGPFAYNGSAQEPCSATVTGPGSLNQSVAVVYGNNTNAGTATATATYAATTNYAGSSDSETFTIDKAASTTVVTCGAGPFTYNGAAQEPCSATVTGAGGLNEAVAIVYTNNTNAGTATATATYAASTNHLGSSDSENFTIGKANTTTVVTCPANATYTGSPLTPCSASVTGAGGLNQSLTVAYSNNTNAGTATASATYAATTNYNASSDTENFTIDKAPSVTDVTCTAGPFTYNGVAQTPCSVSVTGAGGLSLTPTPTYTNNVNAGPASASYTYAGDANHNGSTDTENFTIAKANQTITWSNPANIVYGTALGATQLNASVAGVAGGSAAGALTYDPAAGTVLGAGSHTLEVDAAETSNYNPASKTVTLNVDKKPVTPSVTAGNKTYDGTTTATITGCTVAVTVGTDDVACSAAGATFADKNYGVGKTVTATGIALTGTTAGNYSLTGTTATTTANIDRAPLTITADNKSKVWDGSPFTAFTATYSGLVTGDHTANVPSVGVLTGTLSFSGNATTAVDAGTYTIMPGGYATPNGNYTISYVNGTLTIVDQTAPKATITELNPVPVSTPSQTNWATLKVNVTDVTTGNSNITQWRYNIDGGAYTTLVPSTPAPNVNVQTTIPVGQTTDVINVCVQGKDAGDNWSTIVCALLAVYDPAAGFVTGGGWIDSPAGAYKENASLTGRANFGFVAKYLKGQQTPSGNTEFQFHAAGLNFKSTSYEWLVVQGTTQAQFKGDGTIAGRSGVYGFILTIVDGDNFGQKKPDTFRIKIVEKATGTVVYDNVNTTDDTAPAVAPINGGSIQIQAK